MSIMPWPWARREREADRLEDLASLLDAGLDLGAALADAGAPRERVAVESGWIAALVASGLRLDPIDRAVIEAGEASGEIPRALRDRAAARRAQVVAIGLLLGRLAYPALVLTIACGVTAWLWLIGLGGLGWLSLVIAGGGLAVGIATRVIVGRARRDPAFLGTAVPALAKLLGAWGEVPYLDAMRALHGAGVPIDRAHDLATRTVPIAHVRARLTIAARPLGERCGYVESLAMAGALNEETRQILATGEHAGHLEQALTRAAVRRREFLERSVQRAVVVIGGITYAFAVLVVLLVVFDFYGGLWSRLGGR